MIFNFINNANVLKLFVAFGILTFFIELSTAQDDPISQEIKKEKKDYLGANMSDEEEEELEHINRKYGLNEKEIEARSKQRSGQKTSIIEKYRILRANRKDYMRAKKFEKFKEKKVIGKQSHKTRQRMTENKKKSDARYRKEKNKRKRKSFLNLFK